MVVGRVFVDFSVVKDVVTVGRPSSSEPLVEVLTVDTFLGVIMVNLIKRGLLNFIVRSVIMNVSVVTTASTKGSNGVGH